MDLTHTRRSSAAATNEIAAHFRIRKGEGRISVYCGNASIQLPDLCTPPTAIWILC